MYNKSKWKGGVLQLQFAKENFLDRYATFLDIFSCVFILKQNKKFHMSLCQILVLVSLQSVVIVTLKFVIMIDTSYWV